MNRVRVLAAARRHAKSITQLSREDQLHEALGFVLAALIVMQMNGTFRHTVERWLREWTAEIYGWMH